MKFGSGKKSSLTHKNRLFLILLRNNYRILGFQIFSLIEGTNLFYILVVPRLDHEGGVRREFLQGIRPLSQRPGQPGRQEPR